MSDDSEPRATSRHEKIAKSKEDELQAKKNRIDSEKHILRKMREGRKGEIRKLPKDERKAAKQKLKEDVAKQKEAIERAKADYGEALRESK